MIRVLVLYITDVKQQTTANFNSGLYIVPPTPIDFLTMKSSTQDISIVNMGSKKLETRLESGFSGSFLRCLALKSSSKSHQTTTFFVQNDERFTNRLSNLVLNFIKKNHMMTFWFLVTTWEQENESQRQKNQIIRP